MHQSLTPWTHFDFMHSIVSYEQLLVQRRRQNRRLRSYPTPDAHLDMDSTSEEFEAMKQSHAALLRRVDELEEKFSEISSSLLTEKAMNERRKNSETSRIVRRILLFATRSADKILSFGHPAFGHAPTALCPGNTMCQVVLRSAEAQCTLHDFRILTRFFLQLPSIDCRVIPSDFHVQEASPARLPEIDIRFPTFAALCEALDLKASLRVDGFYRQRRNWSREVRAAQVMGVIQSGASSEGEAFRKVMLGRSRTNSSPGEEVHFLLQRTGEWAEGSYVHGFSLESESNANFLEPEGPSTEPYPLYYRIKWERCPGVKVKDDSIDELVPGAIRSYFPAVILRSNILISTAAAALRDTQKSDFIKILTQK